MHKFIQDMDGSLFRLMVKKINDGDSYNSLFCFGIFDGDNLLAIVNYEGYTKVDVSMDIYAFTPKWCNKTVIKECFRIPFKDLKVRRVTACTSRANKNTRRFLERLGFKLEGIMKRARYNRSDNCIYGMLKKDCKWLGE